LRGKNLFNKGEKKMSLNEGLLKEDEMVYYLNNKKVKDLSNNLKQLLRVLYGVIDDDEIIKCKKTSDFIKPDIIITYKDKNKYVSIKTGRSEIFHQEIVTNFTSYLKEKGISDRTIETFLLYHYGDGTIDGSASERIEYNELRLFLNSRIKEANYELNINKAFIQDIIDRCLFVGTINNAVPADCIYEGDYQYGKVVTREQVKKYIDRKYWGWLNNLHIGPLQFRPHARYYNTEIKSEKKRNELICYWSHFSADLDYICRHINY
jgi:hypothetical protein